MRSILRAGRRCLGVGAIALAVVVAPDRAPAGSLLWDIVTNCVDPNLPGYCVRCAHPVAGSCTRSSTCRDISEVWDRSPDFVAIRDVKMCGCAPPFVHGLALPRTRVSGVEDPARPSGLWRFAWKVAVNHIPKPAEIALAVNPPDQRTEDQLHVHLVRLSVARSALIAHGAAVTNSLDVVWTAAQALADVTGLRSYGVLVAQADPGTFLVTVSARSPEDAFTVARCPRN